MTKLEDSFIKNKNIIKRGETHTHTIYCHLEVMYPSLSLYTVM